MKLVFIDETSDSKFSKYLGLSCVVIDCAFYRGIKEQFQKILNESGWIESVQVAGLARCMHARRD